MITYIYVIITFVIFGYILRVVSKPISEKKNKNEITIEYLHWKKLYYKSLALNNIKNGMTNWNSCHF